MTRVSRNRNGTAPSLLFISARPTANRQKKLLDESDRNVWNVMTDRSSAINLGRSVSNEIFEPPNWLVFLIDQTTGPRSRNFHPVWRGSKECQESMQFHDPYIERLQTWFLYRIIAFSVDCTNPLERYPIS